jgi:protein-arginine kinase activator protein McsA
MTTNIIEKFKAIHGNKYDYSKVEYRNTHEKVCIICPEHGEFWQTPHNHLKGRGCQKCAKINSAKKRRLQVSDFINKARKIHNDKYDYSKVEYVNSQTPVCIICPEHGEFWQTPSNHLKGKGCPKCSYIKRKKSQTYTAE